MRILFLAAAAALIAAPAFAAPDAPAKEKAAPHYDCTKKGNANKAACKEAAAATPAAAPMAKPAAPMMAAKPAPAATPMASKPAPMMAAKPAPAPMMASKPMAMAPSGPGGSMKACAAQWHTLSDAQKEDWKVKGAAMKAKKSGRPLTNYQAFSSECMKK